MIDELGDVQRGQATRQWFFEKFEAHQQEFRSNLDKKVREKLPEPLPRIGIG